MNIIAQPIHPQTNYEQEQAGFARLERAAATRRRSRWLLRAARRIAGRR